MPQVRAGNSIPTATSRRQAPLALLGLLIIAGFVARILLAWYSIGSSDADTWPKFAAAIRQHGLFEVYERSGNVNHPPLAALWWVAVLRLAEATGLRFEVIYKIPLILADAGSCAILWLIWSKRSGIRSENRENGSEPRHIHTEHHDTRAGWLAAALLACSPVAILISAYHCNSDSAYAFLCLLAAYLVMQRKMLWGGLALGAAINVKLIPVLLILPLLSLCRNWRQAGRFVLGLAIAAIPFLPVLLFAAREFARNVLVYTPQPDRWGMGALLYELHQLDRFQESSLRAMHLYLYYGRHLIFSSIGLLSLISLIRRRWDACELGALTFAVFLVLTPGFGVQYTVIVLPLMLATSISWGSVYGTIAGVFLLVVYGINWTGTVPLYSSFDGPLPAAGAMVGVIAWVVLLAFTIRVLIKVPGMRSSST